jgi:hypothetical protein
MERHFSFMSQTVSCQKGSTEKKKKIKRGMMNRFQGTNTIQKQDLLT